MTTTGGAAAEPRWLDEDQQRTWRRWLALSAQLPAVLNRQLQRDCDLSLQDFDVLVQLSEATDGRCRIGALALSLQWERSRMSHHVKRMEARGLVEREECEDDRRGAVVRLREAGREAIATAAPHHVALVHRLMFDAVPSAELEAVGSYLEQALERVRERQREDGLPVVPDGGQDRGPA